MGIGRRIATYRRRRGLSQAALAGLVGRSESWLSQVERGVRSVDRMSVLLDLARILHVDVESLSGRPWQLAPNGNNVALGLAEVRAALTSYNGAPRATSRRRDRPCRPSRLCGRSTSDLPGRPIRRRDAGTPRRSGVS
ncbi:helix-turn-helix domain-containing protein [Kineosporia sp. A_224]|uniref:helix-turn-helix domain-containing protein n=1 Tax=Kineosporia sp. A_224 TaxID=1962180 RepID=UPI000B4AC5BA